MGKEERAAFEKRMADDPWSSFESWAAIAVYEETGKWPTPDVRWLRSLSRNFWKYGPMLWHWDDERSWKALEDLERQIAEVEDPAERPALVRALNAYYDYGRIAFDE